MSRAIVVLLLLTSNLVQAGSTSKRIFVTSTVYSGNIGGKVVANNICQSLATTSGHGGTWEALLGTSAKSIKQILIPYIRVIDLEGNLIFNRKWTGAKGVNIPFADLGAGPFVSMAINLDETGNRHPSGEFWTGAASTGEYASNCSDWTSIAGSGAYGNTNLNTWHSLTNGLCNSTRRFYCIEK